MIVIPPLEVTAARLTSSTVAEPAVGEVAYNAGTAYAKGARVYLGAPASTVTITIASPGVVSWAAHGQPEGSAVILTTTGALPTGMTAGATYYIRNPETGTFQLSLTPGGVPIATTGGQSGTHTATTQVHRQYESLQAANTGNYPLLADSAAWWKNIGPTNKWAMFDAVRNSATEGDSPLTVVITPSERVDALAVLGTNADGVSVTMTVSASPVYTSTVDLMARDVSDWYDYLFAPFATRPSLLLFDLPPYTNGVITVTLTKSGEPVRVGALVIGTQVYAGEAKLDAVSDATNYSKVERDADGNAALTRRRSVPRVAVRLHVPKNDVNTLRELRDALNAVPAVYSTLDDDNTDGYFESVLVLGVYKRFSINLAYPEEAVADLEIEEI